MHRNPQVSLALVTCALLAAGVAPVMAAPARPAQQQPAGQKPAPAAPARAVREQAPEQKAYSEAAKIGDPDKKIEALRKVIEEYPGTSVVEMAESQILTTLVKKVTDGIGAVQEEASKMVGASAVTARGSAATAVASSLHGAGILLEEAEAYARKGVEQISDGQAYVEALKKSFAERQAAAAKRNPDAQPLVPPDESGYAAMATTARQLALVTLGQILDRRGKTAEAEKTFKEAYLLNPAARPAATAAIQLARYAQQAGFDFEQLEYLTVAALAGRLDRDGRADLERVYRKTHPGSPDGLDEMLDERYERTAAKVEVSPYGARAPRAGRTVVAELFTGSGCPPCVAADMAFEAAMERYEPRDLAVLVYHLHIPRPDPMTNPSSLDRAKYYDVGGTPTYFIDGDTRHVGGGSASGAQKLFDDTVEAVVDRRLVAKPSAAVGLGVERTGPALTVAARVSKVRNGGKAVTLHLALVEERVTYSGENGVRFHPMVVRQLARSAGDALGFPVTSGSAKVEYTFDVERAVADAKAHLDDFEVNSTRFGPFEFSEKKHGIDPSRLSVVAFVQDDESKQILQAVWVNVP